MNPRKFRSSKPPAGSNQPSNNRRSDPDAPVPTCSSRKGKNPRKRSRDSDEEASSTPPKKRVNNRHPPSTAHPSPVVKRTPSRRWTRKTSRSPKKEVPVLADPDPDVIVIDDDGHPYVTYDDAPHLHPPPQRYKQSKADRPAEQVKGCSIEACWTPTQQRRCRILQTDPAVEEIGWKKVRKWMQAVRCGLCGEAQVLRDLTKGCFNLEHWWRHLRVRHGIKREEEIQEKGEEKYKTLPIKDHVCVGACSTCGEGEETIFARCLNTRHAARSAAAASPDLSNLSSIDITPDAPREPLPESTTSTSRIEPVAPEDAPTAGPSNAHYPRPHSGLYTLANARPQYQPESASIGALPPLSGPSGLPPLVPQSWAAYVDPSLYLNPPSPRRPITDHLCNSTPQVQQTRPLSSASPSPSPHLPFVQTAPPVARGDPDAMDAADALLFLNRGPPAITVTSAPATVHAASAIRTRARFRSTFGSAQAQTPPQTVASAAHCHPSSVQSTSSGLPRPSHFAAVAAAPGLLNYRWPPVNAIPVGAPSPPEMTAASWEKNVTEDEEDQTEAPSASGLPRSVPTSATEDCVVANGATTAVRPLHRSSLPAWESRADDHERADGLTESTLAPRLQVEAGGTNDPGLLLQPGWAFIKQEEFEPDIDEDDDMVDQLFDDH